MTKVKKMSLWVLGTAGALLLIVVIFAPMALNMAPIRDRVSAAVSNELRGRVDYERVTLSLFPRPGILIQKAGLSLPGKIQGTLGSLRIHPEIVSLLKGQVRINKIRAEEPRFRILVPARAEIKEDTPSSGTLPDIQRLMAPLLAPVAFGAHDLRLEVDKGTLELTQGDRTAFSFLDIHASAARSLKGFDIDLTCKSPLSDGIALKAGLNPDGPVATGQIDLTGLHPGSLTNYLFPHAVYRILDSEANLSITFNLQGLVVWKAALEGSFSNLTISRHEKKAVVRGRGLKAAVSLEGERTSLTMDRLELEHPRLTVSGGLSVDRASSRAGLEFEARDVDIQAVRETALAMAGHVPQVREVFDSVLGGNLSLVSFRSQGTSMADLGKLENMLIKGSVSDAKIKVPGAGFNVEDAKGEAVISKGILEGKGLGARLGKSRAREGVLRLGLQGKDAPLHLDILLDVDLAEAHAVVNALAGSKPFVKEINLIRDLQGRAEGRVVLGGTTQRVKAQADVSKFKVSGTYQGAPYPIQLEGGRFSFQGTEIKVAGLSGAFGNSQFSGLSGHINLAEIPYFDVSMSRAVCSAEEIYSWLATVPNLKDDLKDFKAMRGLVLLDESSFKGSPQKPESWQVNLVGEVRQARLDVTFVPGPITVERGRFHAEQTASGRAGTLEGLEMAFLDTSLTISGMMKGSFQGLENAALHMDGEIGRRSVQWVSDLIRIPPLMDLSTPVSISKGRLEWDRNGATSFAGDLDIQKAVRLSVNMLKNPEALVVNRLEIRDDVSNASLTARLQYRALAFTFSGNLEAGTLHRAFSGYDPLGGRARGDFKAQILLDDLVNSTAEGRLEAHDFMLPWQVHQPLKIETVSLTAGGHKIRVESAELAWGETHLDLRGDAKILPDELWLDLDLETNDLDGQKLRALFPGPGGAEEAGRVKPDWALPIRGSLKIKTSALKYGRFTWRPLHINLSFHSEGPEATVTDAHLCGLSTPGVVRLSPKGLTLDFHPVSEGQELEPAVRCLLDKEFRGTGRFDFTGKISAEGKPEALPGSLLGHVSFKAREGRIYRGGLLGRLLSVLSITEIFRGKLPDIGKEGFGYYSAEVEGDLQNGRIRLKKGVLDGASVDLFGEGEIDVLNNTVDLTVLATTFSAGRAIISSIPLVKEIFKEPLIAVPVRISGSLADPSVVPLSPSALGTQLLGFAKGLLKVPIEVIRGVLPKEKENAP